MVFLKKTVLEGGEGLTGEETPSVDNFCGKQK